MLKLLEEDFLPRLTESVPNDKSCKEVWRAIRPKLLLVGDLPGEVAKKSRHNLFQVKSGLWPVRRVDGNSAMDKGVTESEAGPAPEAPDVKGEGEVVEETPTAVETTFERESGGPAGMLAELQTTLLARIDETAQRLDRLEQGRRGGNRFGSSRTRTDGGAGPPPSDPSDSSKSSSDGEARRRRSSRPKGRGRSQRAESASSGSESFEDRNSRGRRKRQAKSRYTTRYRRFMKRKELARLLAGTKGEELVVRQTTMQLSVPTLIAEETMRNRINRYGPMVHAVERFKWRVGAQSHIRSEREALALARALDLIINQCGFRFATELKAAETLVRRLVALEQAVTAGWAVAGEIEEYTDRQGAVGQAAIKEALKVVKLRKELSSQSSDIKAPAKGTGRSKDGEDRP